MRLVLLRSLWVRLPPLRARLVRLLLLRSLPSVAFCCLLLHSIHVIFCCLLLPSVDFGNFLLPSVAFCLVPSAAVLLLSVLLASVLVPFVLLPSLAFCCLLLSVAPGLLPCLLGLLSFVVFCCRRFCCLCCLLLPSVATLLESDRRRPAV
jgi:hypothetical protein